MNTHSNHAMMMMMIIGRSNGIPNFGIIYPLRQRETKRESLRTCAQSIFEEMDVYQLLAGHRRRAIERERDEED